MIRATILITKKNMTSSHDDKITIRQSDESCDLYTVVYHTPDVRSDRQFTTTEARVQQYLEDVLDSLVCDTDPFEHVQVYTAIHPSVIYHVSDLESTVMRRRILNQIRDALRFDVA